MNIYPLSSSVNRAQNTSKIVNEQIKLNEKGGHLHTHETDFLSYKHHPKEFQAERYKRAAE